MGSSPKTKSQYLNEIAHMTEQIAWYQRENAKIKAMMADPSYKHMKASCKYSLEGNKGHIARLKAEISVAKMKMKDAPKG
jgi:hypothetical protein